MNSYLNIKFSEFELSLFAKVFEEATRGNPFEGLRAVAFLQKSKLSNVLTKRFIGTIKADMVNSSI